VRSDDASVLRASLEAPGRFEEVFDRHHERIWRFLARLGGPECADDLASEVFVIAFARRATFDPERGSVTSWLYGIAANLARTRARRLVRGVGVLGRLRLQRVPDVPVGAALEERDDVASVVASMDQLSAPHREVLVLFAWEELDYQTIAEVLDVEVGTVRSRLARARSHLRELLEPSGQVSDDAQPSRRPPHG
jgi:RNA polymerase sigma-70 factor (ECF subfamily)